MYDAEISASTLLIITDKVIPLIKDWQSRPLEPVYTIAWLDAMYFKVKAEEKVQSRCLYDIISIRKDDRKELLGMYVRESMGANFVLGVISGMQQRCVHRVWRVHPGWVNSFSITPKFEARYSNRSLSVWFVCVNRSINSASDKAAASS